MRSFWSVLPARSVIKHGPLLFAEFYVLFPFLIRRIIVVAVKWHIFFHVIVY